MKAVFAAIVLVFVFWGVGNSGGQTSQTVALVNGARITDGQFTRMRRQMARQMGGSPTEEQLKEIDRKVIKQLIQEEVLVQEAQRIGLVVSEDEIGRYVLRAADFKDGSGKFNMKLYETTLKRLGMTRSNFEESVRRQMLQDKVIQQAMGSIRVSPKAVERAYVQQQTQLEIAWIAVPDSALIDDVVVDDAAIDAYLATSVDAVKSRYDADFDRLYNQPRKASFSMILLRDDVGPDGKSDPQATSDTMARVREQAVGGADFAELARTWSEDIRAGNGGDMGMLAEPQMDPALARAVFSTEPGGITEVIEGRQGLQLVRVNEIVEARVVALAEVERDIAKQLLASDQASSQASAFAEKLLAEWKNPGEPPVGLLAEQGLSVQHTGAFAAGDTVIPKLGVNPGLSRALESIDGAQVIEGVYPTATGRIVAAVESYTPADMEAFEGSKDTIETSLLMVEQAEFAQAWVDDLVARSTVVQHMKP